MTEPEIDEDFIPGEDNPFLTTKQVAQMFGVGTQTVSLWYREGKMKAIKLDRDLRFPLKVVKKYAQKRYGDGTSV